MRTLIRLFFRTLRIVLGPFMLLWEWLTRPQGIVRQPSVQTQVDRECRSLVLYQFKTCPFCIRVRQEMRRLSLMIERRNAQHEGPHRDELVAGGGKAMVPCLQITEAGGEVRWLYESGAIIDYLRERFGTPLKVVDGRPGYAKPSIDGGKQEEIAVIDPDFE